MGFNRTTPVTVYGNLTATAIATGGYHSCALLIEGTVKCWGDNQYGQLGDGQTTLRSAIPIKVSGLSNVIAIAAGKYHACALLAGGAVKCWGDNYWGQLGVDTTTLLSTTPVLVSGNLTASAITAGFDHTCALLIGGTVKCWGFNGKGELGNGTQTITPNPTPVPVSGNLTATAITAGGHHTCAILVGGVVNCWGYTPYGELGVSAGTTPFSTTPVPVSGNLTVTNIAAGYAHTCALLTQGTMQCWGSNSAGQLGDGNVTTLANPTPVTVVGFP